LKVLFNNKTQPKKKGEFYINSI